VTKSRADKVWPEKAKKMEDPLVLLGNGKSRQGQQQPRIIYDVPNSLSPGSERQLQNEVVTEHRGHKGGHRTRRAFVSDRKKNEREEKKYGLEYPSAPGERKRNERTGEEQK